MRRLLLSLILLLVATGSALAQPVVLEQLPPNGSVQAAGCGPFGVRLQPGVLSATDDALLVRGSATGERVAGRTFVSSAGDSLYFVPAIPFAPGEEVQITLRSSLRSGGVSLAEGLTWRVRIRPADEHLTTDLGSLVQQSVSLAPWFNGTDLDLLGWQWGDLNGDGILEGVLLANDGGLHHLMTVAGAYDAVSQMWSWTPRGPSAVTRDNPVELLAVGLNPGRRQDLVLLTLAGLQVWLDPAAELSPVGGDAQWLAFPVGFNGRALVAGDLDADGDEDLVVLGLFGQDYLVYLNDGVGGLAPQGVRAVEGAPLAGDKSLPWPVQATLGDVDGDGRLDLVWAAEYQEQGRYPIRLALGLGDGGFAAAGILDDGESFTRGLFVGRTLDPWDDSPDGAMVLTAGPDLDGDRLCGLRYNGAFPAQVAGCLAGPGLGVGSSTVALTHFLASDVGGVYPELWYLDGTTGALTARPLGEDLLVTSRSLPAGVAGLAAGDLDFDGDGDLVVAVPGQAELILLRTPGGAPRTTPGPVGVVCGGTVDFGAREILCAAAAVPWAISFGNEGLLPARIENVSLDDPAGVFNMNEVPTQWFGSGCFGAVASVILPVEFAPADTIAYSAALTVTVTWVGAATGGADSTLVCDFLLTGTGGVFGATGNGSGPGDLHWDRDAGYLTTGGGLQLGPLPALAGVEIDTTFQFTNSGSFALSITPPTEVPEPWLISPPGPRLAAPGETLTWNLQVRPRADLLPDGIDTLPVSAALVWQIEPAALYHCLTVDVLHQSLGATLLRADPQLAPDPDCSDAPQAAATVDTIRVMEDDPFEYCLQVMGWDWPGADPRLEIEANPLAWLEAVWDSRDAVPGIDHGRVRFVSDLIGPAGATVTVEIRDGRFATLTRTFSLVLLVEPARPDLRVVEMLFSPLEPGGDIQQQDPFNVDVVVAAERRPALGADLSLDGGECSCGVGPLDKAVLDLEVGQQDTVRFVIESCDAAGDCGFTACIAPAEGLDGDFNPDDNCFTIDTLVAADKAPSVEFFDLTLNPADPGLEPCQDGVTLNQIIDGQVAALGVREENNLSFSVRALDEDGDERRLVVESAPDFVTVTTVNDTLLSFSVDPPEGTVVQEVCELFGPLRLQVYETSVALPETTTVEVPLYVKWEGPDLSVTLNSVPNSAALQEDVRLNAVVRCQGYDSGPFSVDLWVTDPDGVRVAGRVADLDGLAAGQAIPLPQILFTVEKPGEYCAHASIIAGRDLNPNNNSDESCFPVASGPFVVSPNVATPNGDGHNDLIEFHFANQTLDNPRLRIFELGGRKVYESDTLDGQRRLTWNGRNTDGRMMPPGTYVYVVYDDRKEFRKGTCGVIR